ncbi:hypothetical protein PTKIN_Ptkin02bG0037700 [Pterospermum kingtungense]
MAKVSSSNDSTSPISFNSAAQLPLKLNTTNFPSWQLQFNSLIAGHALTGYLTGDSSPPLQTITNDKDVSVPNLDYIFWYRQDQLLLNAMVASCSKTVVPLIAMSKTSKEAWDKLTIVFASKIQSRVMSLNKKLMVSIQGDKSVTDYMNYMKGIADDLILALAPVTDDDLVIFILNGLTVDYKEISVAIRARETPISFEELYDKLTDYENVLKQREEQTSFQLPASINYVRRGRGSFSNRGGPSRGGYVNNLYSKCGQNFQKRHPHNGNTSKPICQLRDRISNTAQTCRTAKNHIGPLANVVAFKQQDSQNWLMDSSASHHVTFDLANL